MADASKLLMSGGGAGWSLLEGVCAMALPAKRSRMEARLRCLMDCPQEDPSGTKPPLVTYLLQRACPDRRCLAGYHACTASFEAAWECGKIDYGRSRNTQ